MLSKAITSSKPTHRTIIEPPTTISLTLPPPSALSFIPSSICVRLRAHAGGRIVEEGVFPPCPLIHVPPSTTAIGSRTAVRGEGPREGREYKHCGTAAERALSLSLSLCLSLPSSMFPPPLQKQHAAKVCERRGVARHIQAGRAKGGVRRRRGPDVLLFVWADRPSGGGCAAGGKGVVAATATAALPGRRAGSSGAMARTAGTEGEMVK